MAGYDDTYKMIIECLMGRPNGTEIQPEKHQEYALNMLEYIRSLELVANAPLIGIAQPNTQPIQPDNSRAAYYRSSTKSHDNLFAFPRARRRAYQRNDK